MGVQRIAFPRKSYQTVGNQPCARGLKVCALLYARDNKTMKVNG